MKSRISRKIYLFVAAFAVVGAWSAQAATIVFSDDFTDGTVSPWIDETDVTLSVADDTGGLGSGNALFGDTSVSVNRTLARFDAVTLANAGDWIEVSLDFRFDGTLSVDRFTPAIGLYSTNGTSSDISNDQGYAASVSSAADSAGDPDTVYENTLGREDETLNNDPDPTHGILAGSDVSSLFEDNTDDVLQSGENYDITFRITRTASSEAFLEYTLNGALAEGGAQLSFSATDTDASPFFGFDQFGLRNRNNDFAIDNVIITTNIPEPASLALLGLGVTALVGRRRRRR